MDGRTAILVLAAGLLIAGCRAPGVSSRGYVADALAERTGSSVSTSGCPGESSIPPGVVVEDGLTEDEAVTLALWNNAAWRQLLAQLGISEARLFDAGLLTDPQMQVFFPVGPKQFEMTVFQAIDAVWLRPVRIRAAELGLGRVAEQSIQNGLDVARDARVAHADLLLAQQRADLAADALTLRTQIGELAEKQLEAGDTSELETVSARTDAIAARADAARFKQDVTLAQNRLRTIVGLALYPEPIVAVESPVLAVVDRPAEDLIYEAFATRPDLRAAEIAVAENRENAQLARCRFFQVDGVFDANGRGRDGFESGPGLRLTLPIFNRNRGNIAIADAMVRESEQALFALRDRVAEDVRNAAAQESQARENLAIIESELLPALEDSVELSQKNYERGAAPYLLVLQTTSGYLDARTRRLEQQAALRRALAELERSVGRRFATHPESTFIPAPGPSGVEVPAPDGDAADPQTPEFNLETDTNRVRDKVKINPHQPDAQAKTVPHQPAAQARAAVAKQPPPHERSIGESGRISRPQGIETRRVSEDEATRRISEDEYLHNIHPRLRVGLPSIDRNLGVRHTAGWSDDSANTTDASNRRRADFRNHTGYATLDPQQDKENRTRWAEYLHERNQTGAPRRDDRGSVLRFPRPARVWGTDGEVR